MHIWWPSIKTGEVVWDVAAEEPKNGYAFTLAPLVVRDKVIVGAAGGDFATRGFIDTYNAETGERAWCFYTVPSPGDPGSESWPDAEVMSLGGGGVWVTGSYDPGLNLLYCGSITARGTRIPTTWVRIKKVTSSSRRTGSYDGGEKFVPPR